MDKRFRVGVIGAGAISGRYIGTIQKKFPSMEVVSVCAAHRENAEKKAREYGIAACTLEEMLSDPSIDIVLNLTPVGAHYEIVKKALLAGKHVYTEKTMTDDPKTAGELAALAKEKGLYLGCAPDTFLGAAVQTARKAVDGGAVGEVTSFGIAANRSNDLLLSLFAFLREPGAGVCYDYAVYYITALVNLLGPVDQVSAVVRAPYPTHVNILPQSPDFGKVMDTPNESQVSAVLRMKSGVAGTFMVNSDSVRADQAFFAIYGTKGILYLTDPNQFGGDVMLLREQEDLQKPLIREKLEPVNPYFEESRGLGAADLAEAVRTGSRARTDAEMAVHVLDVLCAMLESGETGRCVTVESHCERPRPLTGGVEENDPDR